MPAEEIFKAESVRESLDANSQETSTWTSSYIEKFGFVIIHKRNRRSLNCNWANLARYTKFWAENRSSKHNLICYLLVILLKFAASWRGFISASVDSSQHPSPPCLSLFLQIQNLQEFNCRSKNSHICACVWYPDSNKVHLNRQKSDVYRGWSAIILTQIEDYLCKIEVLLQPKVN